MKLTVTNTSPLPLYRQMYDQLAAQILRGEIAPGEVLPPIRTVAQELSVSLISVRRAWEELERDGFIHTAVGRGTFAAALGETDKAAMRRAILKEKLTDAAVLRGCRRIRRGSGGAAARADEGGKRMRKKLLLIATGGTIASRPAEDGLTPEMTSEELLQCIPEVRSLCEIDTVQPFNLDSTNMRPQNWVELVKIIREKYESYDGFVITHGTDTMAYAAATLYYLIQNSPKPVVLTGSQVSIYARDTDARENLRNAITYAADEDACGIHLVFDNKVICANRAQKTRTRSFNAFSSIDYPEVAVIRGGEVRYYIRESFPGPVRFYDALDSRVCVIKLIPGMAPGILDYVAEHAHAVVIESFGVGGVPYYDNDEFTEKIGHLLRNHVKVIFTTQVSHEGSDMELYRVGFRIKKKYELLEAYTMTTEAVVAKVEWALANSADDAEFRKLFLTPVGNDRL